MSYKLAAVDMDGTLLDSSNNISSATISAVEKLRLSGKYFCLTTGRPPVAIARYHELLELDTPVISYNGARIFRMKCGVLGEVLYEQLMEQPDAIRVLELGYANGVTMCLWENDRLFTNVVNEHSLWYQTISGADMDTMPDLRPEAAKGVTKILWCGTAEDITAWNSLAERELGGAVSHASSGPTLLEFFDRRVSKGAALARLCGTLGVDIGETVALGDGFNDLPMLEAAGLSVAMANAPAGIREKCDFVTASNDEDGVRLALEKFMLV